MSEIDEIKDRLDIVDLVSETVKLRHTGKNYIGFCPFHPNSKTEAFVVFPESGTWRCFGQCNEGGDIFKFVMKKENWDFAETLKYLAERAGVTLHSRRQESPEEIDQHERLRTLLEEAVVLYHSRLLQSDAGKSALVYLQKRGLKAETIEKFGLGCAPDEWDIALKFFQNKGYSTDDLTQAGLIVQRQDGSGFYDRFRNRIMIPIRNANGKMCGFGARILNPEDVPKFINSPQTPLFDKGKLLYGLDLARKPIRTLDYSVLVEGYLDVILLHQAGFENTVSPMGTAVTEDQVRLMKKFSRKIVIALDPDAAGEKATLRGLQVARQAMDHTEEMVFDSHGLVRSEQRLDADIRICQLPEGLDPDEVALRSPAEWQQIVDSAQPVVQFVMNALSAGKNLDDAKVKREIAEQVLPLIDDISNSIEREEYRQKLFLFLKINENILVASRRQKPGARPRREAGRQELRTVIEGPQKRREQIEAHCLSILINQPELLVDLNRNLQKNGLNRLEKSDFVSSELQELALLLFSSMAQAEAEPRQYIENNLPAGVQEEYARVKSLRSNENDPRRRVIEDLVQSFIILRREKVNEDLDSMKQLLVAQQITRLSDEEYLRQFQGLMESRNRLDRLKTLVID